MVLVVAHEAHAIITGELLPVDPFVHVLAEMAIFVPGSAMLFAAVAEIRNRFVRG